MGTLAPAARESACDWPRLCLEQTRAAQREPELMALLGIVGVDAELAEPSDPIDHGVAAEAEAFGGLADTPAVKEGLERCDELQPTVRRPHGQRAEHPVYKGPHRVEIVGERREDPDLGDGVHRPPRVELATHLECATRLLR